MDDSLSLAVVALQEATGAMPDASLDLSLGRDGVWSLSLWRERADGKPGAERVLYGEADAFATLVRRACADLGVDVPAVPRWAADMAADPAVPGYLREALFAVLRVAALSGGYTVPAPEPAEPADGPAT